MEQKSFMESESEESPSIIANQQKMGLDILDELSKRLLKYPPNFVGTIARGSSDHAAYFAKYAIETKIGIITTSIAPSVHTIYKSNINYKNSLVVGISQSGKSDDILECMAVARKNGAVTLSFVNTKNSPLEKESEYCIPLLAGKEKSVAATKSFIASLSRIIQLVAYWSKNNDLKNNLINFPSLLVNKTSTHLHLALNELKNERNILIIGRGFTFPIALESALKLKETCGLHAEAFSGAEILHGPFELVHKNFPVLVYLQNDETLPGILKLIEILLQKEAKVIAIASQNILNSTNNPILNKTITIPTNNSLDPLCDAISLIHSFYPFAALLSKAKERNPDHPKNLNKITRTI